METIAAILSLSFATVKFIKVALHQHASVNRNDAMVKELEQFVEELEHNIDVLKNIDRNGFEDETVAKLAVDALSKDMAYVRDKLDEIVGEMSRHRIVGRIMSDAANSTAQRIGSLRERIHRSFQTNMLMLSVALGQTHGKNLRRILTSVDEARNENQLAIAHILDRLQTHEEYLLHTRESNLKATIDSQKFFEDVMTGLEYHQRPSEHNSEHTRSKTPSPVSVNLGPLEKKDKLNAVPEWYEDPITRDVMYDPVIASDGCTYDRWTIVEKRGPDPCLHILKDNTEMLELIIEHFPDQEEHLWARRITYKEDALQRYYDGKQEEALLMLGHVLEWDASDQECLDIVNDHAHKITTTTNDETSSGMGILTYWKSYNMHAETCGSFHETVDANSQWFDGLRSTQPGLKMEMSPYLSSSSSFYANENEPYVSLSMDGLHIKFQASPTWLSNAVVAFKANQVVDSSNGGVFYFELAVHNHGRPHKGCVAIGFSDANFMPDQLPGHIKNSCAYHSDTGRVLCTTDLQLQEDNAEGCDEDGMMQNTTFSEGDVVGAGIDHRSNTIFYVKNGQKIKKTSRFLKMFPSEKLFPVVGLWMPVKEVRINFGQRPFRYSLHLPQ